MAHGTSDRGSATAATPHEQNYTAQPRAQAGHGAAAGSAIHLGSELDRERSGGALFRGHRQLASEESRVLSIAASLLSAPRGALVVIEEIDNGVHPSRAQHLVETIRKTEGARGVRVLLTTHNPALMNALPVDVLARVVVCYRDEAGNSRLVKLEDVSRYPELLSQGRLGDVATSGLLERFVKQGPNEYAYEPFFDLLKASDGNP
jgi:hypothetical protein